MKTLFPPQERSCEILHKALLSNNAALDSSDTGTGKTVVALELVKRIGVPALVICPKVVVPAWRTLAEEQGVELLDVINYEKLQTGTRPWGRWRSAKRTLFDFQQDIKFIIWDEVHRCKAYASQRSRMLTAAKSKMNLMLSATAADSPLEMRALGYILGLHNNFDFWSWAAANGCEKGDWGWEFPAVYRDVMLPRLAAQIYPSRGYRLTREDLGEFFQPCSIVTEPLDFGADAEKGIERAYALMEKELAELEERKQFDQSGAAGMTTVLRARQEVELLKIPTLVDMATDLEGQGFSVVVFLNFTASIEAFRGRFGKRVIPVIQGGQSEKERSYAITSFQADSETLIVVNAWAGGESISLHDQNGKRRRFALISPDWDAKKFLQLLGRVDRAGSKSPSIQRILFASNTVEDRVRAQVNEKVRNIRLLQTMDTTADTTANGASLFATSLMDDLNKEKQDLHRIFQSITVLVDEGNKTVVLQVNRPGISAEELLPNSQHRTVTRRLRKAWEKTFGTPSNKVDWEIREYGAEAPVATKAAAPVAPVAAAPANGHARYSPSSLSLFEGCPSYAKKVDEEVHEMTLRGTQCHEAAEKDDPSLVEDPQDQALVAQAINTRELLLGQLLGPRESREEHREIKVRINLGSESTFGTADHFAVVGNRGVLIDYKFGWGAVEDAETNVQGQAYAAGLFQMFPQVQEMYVVFMLLRRGQASMGVFTRAGNLPNMLARVRTIIARAKAMAGKEFHPGMKWCQYCGNIGTCRAWHEKALDAVKAFGPDDFIVPRTMRGGELNTPEEIAVALRLTYPLEDLIKSVRERARQAAFEEDMTIPGFDKEFRTSPRTLKDAAGTWFAIEQREIPVTLDEFLSVVPKIGIGDFEKLVGSKAPKGQKAQYVSDFMEHLAGEGILTGGDTQIGVLKQAKV